jgi:hypothetical protein
MRFHNSLTAIVALVLAASACAQTVPGQNPATRASGPAALQLNVPPTTMFLGNAANRPGSPLQLNTPPATMSLGNVANGPGSPLQLNTPPTTLSLGNGLGPAMELNRPYNGARMNGARGIFYGDQRRPHGQLRLPYVGFHALENPDVQRQLDLTDQQMQDVSEILDWSREQMQDISLLAATDSAQAEQAYREYRRDRRQQLSKVLTPDQQSRWQQVTGESFNLSPPFMVTVPSGR